MLINISIHADNPADYRDALKALNEGAGLAELDLGEILPEVKVTPVAAKTAPARPEAPVQAPVPSTEELPIPAPEAQQQAPVPAQNWAPGGSTQDETVAKPVTLNELQALGRKVALAGHQDVLAKVLAKYGASNLSSVPEESRAAALADLEAANG